jgi:hypothetical protein
VPHQKDVDLAKEQMRQAEADLDRCVRSGAYNPERHRQLADAVRIARDEFIEQVASMVPDLSQSLSDQLPLGAARHNRNSRKRTGSLFSL